MLWKSPKPPTVHMRTHNYDGEMYYPGKVDGCWTWALFCMELMQFKCPPLTHNQMEEKKFAQTKSFTYYKGEETLKTADHLPPMAKSINASLVHLVPLKEEPGGEVES